MSASQKVTTIPAKRKAAAPGAGPARMRRVACYSRVSSDDVLQLNSLETQKNALPDLVRSHSDWVLVGEYCDEGVSGTSTRGRDGFNRMVSDALAGKFDLIVCKSISRLARNTVDSLNVIRRLKEKGVEIYFDKEKIWTFDAKGELMLTILSSLAQEESRSISENIKWGLRKRFADGKYWVAYSKFLGYERGPNGEMAVEPAQAAVVRHIYGRFLQGCTLTAICREMDESGIAPPGGGKCWSLTYVRNLLTNIKYRGANLSQMSYVADFLTHKCVRNNGELPMYYSEGGHEAIIDPAIFEMVQEELQRRGRAVRGRGVIPVFGARLRCAACGRWFGRKILRSRSRAEQYVWQCGGAREHVCAAPTLAEETLRAASLQAINGLTSAREEVLRNLEELAGRVGDTAAKEARLRSVRTELSSCEEAARMLIRNAALPPMKAVGSCAALESRMQSLEEERERLSAEIQSAVCRREQFGVYLRELAHTDLIGAFSEDLFKALVDYGTVWADGRIVFTLKDGREVTAAV